MDVMDVSETSYLIVESVVLLWPVESDGESPALLRNQDLLVLARVGCSGGGGGGGVATS